MKKIFKRLPVYFLYIFPCYCSLIGSYETYGKGFISGFLVVVFMLLLTVTILRLLWDIRNWDRLGD